MALLHSSEFWGDSFAFEYMPTLNRKHHRLPPHYWNINVIMTVSWELLKFTEVIPTPCELPEGEFKIKGSTDSYKNVTEFHKTESLTAIISTSVSNQGKALFLLIISSTPETEIKMGVSMWHDTESQNISSRRRNPGTECYLCSLAAEWPQANYLSSLLLNFLTCNMAEIVALIRILKVHIKI